VIGVMEQLIEIQGIRSQVTAADFFNT